MQPDRHRSGVAIGPKMIGDRLECSLLQQRPLGAIKPILPTECIGFEGGTFKNSSPTKKAGIVTSRDRRRRRQTKPLRLTTEVSLLDTIDDGAALQRDASAVFGDSRMCINTVHRH